VGDFLYQQLAWMPAWCIAAAAAAADVSGQLDDV